MATKNQYIKCPRCELNYILKKDKYCDVCKSEMRAGILEESDLDDFDLEEGLELCPICKVNYISEGERMCSTCLEEQTDVKDDEPDWRGFVDKADESDDEDLDLLPVEEDDEIDEELEGAFAKDLEQEFGDDDDLDGDDEEDLDDELDDFNSPFDDDAFDDDEEDDDVQDEDDEEEEDY